MRGEGRCGLMLDAPSTKPAVDAYLGLGSRYSYLASTQLDRIAADVGVTFNWIPIVSADLFASGRNPFEGTPISPQYEMRYREADARAWADYYVVPFREPAGRLSFDPALLVRAALAAGDARVGMMKRLFQAVFADERTRIDAADVADFAPDGRIGSLQVPQGVRRSGDRSGASRHHRTGQEARRLRRSLFSRRQPIVLRQRPAHAAAPLSGDDAGRHSAPRTGRERSQCGRPLWAPSLQPVWTPRRGLPQGLPPQVRG
jgi:2-hydroxychromene-2-carboxylate isomerase